MLAIRTCRWSQLHARDPRSKQLTAAESRGQQTLLEWARVNLPDAATRASAQCGRPPDYKLHFGQPGWQGWTPRQLVQLAAKGHGAREKAMQDGMPQGKQRIPPGEYVLWICGATSTQPFVFHFPYHFNTYLAMRELEVEGCSVVMHDGSKG